MTKQYDGVVPVLLGIWAMRSYIYIYIMPSQNNAIRIKGAKADIDKTKQKSK